MSWYDIHYGRVFEVVVEGIFFGTFTLLTNHYLNPNSNHIPNPNPKG